MGTMWVRKAIPIALAVACVTGCGTLSSKAVKSDVGAPGGQVTAALDATGGRSAWQQCRYFEVTGVVSAYQEDGGVYLTEHTFHVSPASHALSISAHEPQADYVWQLVGHQFRRAEGNPSLDVSPLQPEYADYAEAVLEILTAPVRLQEWGGRPARESITVMIGGRAYHPIETGSPAGLQRVYYQDEANARIDLIWLANSDRSHFTAVRGYDYVRLADAEILIPTKIEVFRSDASRQIGSRMVRIDMRP